MSGAERFDGLAGARALVEELYRLKASAVFLHQRLRREVYDVDFDLDLEDALGRAFDLGCHLDRDLDRALTVGDDPADHIRTCNDYLAQAVENINFVERESDHAWSRIGACEAAATRARDLAEVLGRVTAATQQRIAERERGAIVIDANVLLAMPQPARPTRRAVQLAAAAVRLLPSGHRSRYLEEFTAELHVLAGEDRSSWAQLAYALSLLARIWPLRRGLVAPRSAQENRQ